MPQENHSPIGIFGQARTLAAFRFKQEIASFRKVAIGESSLDPQFSVMGYTPTLAARLAMGARLRTASNVSAASFILIRHLTASPGRV
jgi:hypothetical protein